MELSHPMGNAVSLGRNNYRVIAAMIAFAVLTTVFGDKKGKSDAQTPPKTIAELEIECLKVLKYNPDTRDITRVGIVRLNPEGSGPNWTVVKYEPLPSAIGLQIARDLI